MKKESIFKKALIRMLISFAATVVVTDIVMLINTAIMIHTTGDAHVVPLVPSYAVHFSNSYIALIVQTLLCGLIGMSFGGCSVILDFERWSMIKQGIVHFLLTSIVWIPISVFCWGLGKYKTVYISILISFCFTYTVTWGTKILYYRKTTKKINQRLLDIQKECKSEMV